LRLRAGLAVDNLLFYVTGGSAIADATYDANDTDEWCGTDNNVDFNEIGFVVGGGAEWGLDEHWSIRAEALYYIFNDEEDAGNLTGDPETVDDNVECMGCSRQCELPLLTARSHIGRCWERRLLAPFLSTDEEALTIMKAFAKMAKRQWKTPAPSWEKARQRLGARPRGRGSKLLGYTERFPYPAGLITKPVTPIDDDYRNSYHAELLKHQILHLGISHHFGSLVLDLVSRQELLGCPADGTPIRAIDLHTVFATLGICRTPRNRPQERHDKHQNSHRNSTPSLLAWREILAH
jgi:hypothetical protein